MITDKTALKYARELNWYMGKNCNLYSKCRKCPITQDKCGKMNEGFKLLIEHLEAVNGKNN